MIDPRRKLGRFVAASAAAAVLWGSVAGAQQSTFSPDQQRARAQGREPAGGVVVLALDGAADAAWPLAQTIYADAGLKPSLDDATARALAGEQPKEGGSTRTKELFETRGAVHGDDAPSRRILASLARELGASGILVVTVTPAGTSCRLFLPQSGHFDVMSLSPDPRVDGSPLSWTAAVEALRARVPARGETRGPVAPAPSSDRQAKDGGGFLGSVWFWGAIVVAGVAGGVFLATRKSGSDGTSTTIDLRARVAK